MRRATRGKAIVALGLGLVSGCGPAASDPSSRAEAPVAAPDDRGSTSGPAAQVGGDVVATVDGVPITLHEVETLARTAHLTPALALERLEDELVLGGLAERTELARDPEVESAARRAAVRELLVRVVEPTITPETVSSEDLDARRAQISGGLSMPETRRAVHVLVTLEADADEARLDAAFRLARSLRDELAGAPDLVAAMDAMAGRRGAFEIVVEHLDPMARADLEAPFGDALFAATEPGLLPEVVRTSYGVHVIDLVAVVPAWEVPREEWEPVLRRQIAAEGRAAALEELAATLASRTRVEIDPRAQALAESAPLEPSAGGS
ncbi:MAG: peptidylprolyl isomerase [Sandaracinaceae bacterium]|nr:peptidylprolyl isomerase [Sandaracinaceae bacterium]